MAESESIKDIVNQAAKQADTVVMMAFKDTDTGPWPAIMPSQCQNQRQRDGGLVLKRLKFN